jgi:O-antigen/teichoic acid export membrane protein
MGPDRAPRLRLGDALRNLLFKALSLGLERGGRMLVAVAAASTLGRAPFGRFVFASTVTAMLAQGTDLGLSLWTTRTLARGRGGSEEVVRLGLALRALAAVPYGFAVAGAAVVASRGEGRAAVAWLGVAALLDAFADHFGAVLRGYERFADEARLTAMRAVLVTGGGLAALGVDRSLTALCAVMAAAGLGGFAYGLVTLLRIHASGSGGAPLDWTRCRVALRQSLPIWFTGLVSLVYFKIDTLFLHAMAGDAELGLYGAAYKLFEGARLLPAVLLAVIFAQLARAHGDPPLQRRLERQVAASLLGLGLLVGTLGFLFRTPLVETVFGAGFHRAGDSLAVLALGLPVLYLNAGLTHFLVARNMERVTTWLSLLMLALNVGLDVTLIPHEGGAGAALATVLSELVLTASCLGALWMGDRRRRRPSPQAAPRTDQRAA